MKVILLTNNIICLSLSQTKVSLIHVNKTACANEYPSFAYVTSFLESYSQWR